jgi:L,D-peptidoglycan transpeptidase YkuD (ErfK/YbiS/YcfS/YnhG family)
LSGPRILVDAAARVLTLGEWSTPCAIGKGGFIAAADKREGDGKTPLGLWPVRAVLLRPDRAQAGAVPGVPWRWLRETDGWSDDPADPAYNRPVRLPRTTSHERLWREDQAYDAIVVLGHNDAPPLPGLGSAIFFHIWTLDEAGDPRGTEGCVAIAPDAMRAILPRLVPSMAMEII